MRLLHTSDWHLGQTLHDFDRSAEHQHFLDWLLDTLEAQNVDALVIAGDIFDTANPSAAAQRQLYTFLAEARRRIPQLAMALIAGNHDSPGRLEAPLPLLDTLGATVVGSVPRLAGGGVDIERLVAPLRNGYGDVIAWCLAVPFLRPGDVPSVEGEGDGFARGVEFLYRQACEAALARRESHQPIIALGHCHMVGGEVSEESERRIVIGGSEALSADIFHPDIAYVALGHLHRPQRVGGKDHIRYSGSPLPMSFAERDYPHQVVIVDFEDGKFSGCSPLHIPRPVPFLRVPEKPAPLDDVVTALQTLDVPDGPQPYVEVLVRLDAPEPGLRAKIEEALMGKDVRLVKISISRPQLASGGSADVPLSLSDLERLDPQTVFEKLCDTKNVAAEHRPPLTKLFQELLVEDGEEEALV